MAEFTGSAIAACFNAVRLPNVTRVSVEDSAAVQKLDTTSSGDATGQMIDSIPDPVTVTITVSGWDDSGATNTVSSGSVFNAGTSGSIDVYPEVAAASGKPWKYVHVSQITRRTFGPAVREVATYEITIENKASGSLVHSVTA